MLFRYQVPITMDLYSKEMCSMDLNISFLHMGYSCFFELIGEEPIEVALEEDVRFFRKIKGIRITINGEKTYKIKKLLADGQYEAVVTLFSSIINRCIKALRNHGFVPIREVKFQTKQYKGVLLKWKSECSENGENWVRAVDSKSLYDFFYRETNDPLLNMTRWADIEVAIRENKQAPTVNEFTINSIEHLSNENYRLSLLESIIGLEIVLTEFIGKYMERKSINNDWKGLGLSSRISVLLPLIFNSKDLNKLDIENVLKAIKWRNKITHETGHIPNNIQPQAIQYGINAVLNLTNYLHNSISRIDFLLNPFYHFTPKTKKTDSN